MPVFPIDPILPAVADSLTANRCVVLQAPPGTGKTTRVAPFLLCAPWLAGRKILLLEPRRMAARAAANYMAKQLGEVVGDTIGYHIRLERRSGSRTRIEILTEGLLTQRLLHDPELADTGIIIFDEFHERSLAADTGLALALDLRRALRPDLRLLVMSATFDPAAVARHLDHADTHSAHASLHPVTTRLLARNSTAPLHRQAFNAILRALQDEGGSILVFLPGEGEIRRTQELLQQAGLPANVSLHPLYGSLARGLQEEAVAPPAPGRRKIVLATSIAETSLTIEGIGVVIDCGWMRVPRFSPRNGMSRLETLRITRDRADQRRGRAGRLGPGTCLRLWDEATDQQLAPEALPEILDADLATTMLQAADWGTTAREGLPWLTAPPDAAWRQAAALLQSLGALDASMRITERGRKMVKLPAHPRLAHMIIQAAQAGAAQRASLLAAAITEAATDGSTRFESDVRRLLDRLSETSRSGFAQRVRELAHRWARGYPARDTGRPSDGLLLSWAYPDRIARRRGKPGEFLLRSGQGAVIEDSDPLAHSPWLVAAELQDGAIARIRLAAPITPEEIQEYFSHHFESRATTAWNRRTEAVQAVQSTMLGAIVIHTGDRPAPDPVSVRAALLEGVRCKGLDQLPWTKSSRSLRARINFLHGQMPDKGWPDLSDAALLRDLELWLGPFCDGLSRWSHLLKLDLTACLLAYLHACGAQRRQLDELAPTHLPVPSGSSIQVRYDQTTPYMEVRIQELFGMARTPAVAAGRVPVVMHLLSPAQRPVQVTSDLASFWANGYALVRKDLRGRYPKHYWPEDPSQAIPTRRARPLAAKGK